MRNTITNKMRNGRKESQKKMKTEKRRKKRRHEKDEEERHSPNWKMTCYQILTVRPIIESFVRLPHPNYSLMHSFQTC